MATSKPKKKQNQAPLIGGVLVVLILVIAGVGYAYHRNSSSKTSSVKKPASTINYSGPTKQEQQAGTDQKSQIVQDKQDSSTSKTTTATPIISYAGQSGNVIEVSSYVAGVTEDGGTCTMTATQGSLTVTKTDAAVMNATTTNCPSFIMDRSEFAQSGTWNVVVSYASSTASGTSSTSTMEVK